MIVEDSWGGAADLGLAGALWGICIARIPQSAGFGMVPLTLGEGRVYDPWPDGRSPNLDNLPSWVGSPYGGSVVASKEAEAL
jgi:hypothetical protein